MKFRTNFAHKLKNTRNWAFFTHRQSNLFCNLFLQAKSEVWIFLKISCSILCLNTIFLLSILFNVHSNNFILVRYFFTQRTENFIFDVYLVFHLLQLRSETHDLFNLSLICCQKKFWRMLFWFQIKQVK